MSHNTESPKKPQDSEVRKVGAAACLSEYGLDRHLLQLESDEVKAQSLQHIASCTACQRDVDAWHAAQAAPVSLPAAPGLWQQLIEGWGSALFGPVMATAAVAAVALLMWKQISPHPQPLVEPGQPHQVVPGKRPLTAPRWRIKGSSQPGLLVKRTRKGQVTTLEDRGTFAQGDDVQLHYRWLAGRFVFVVHRDAKGALSPLHPGREEAQSAPIHQGGFQPLPDSFSVSGPATGDEEVWACFTSKPLHYKAIAQQLRKHRPLHKGNKAQRSVAKASGATCAWLRFVMKRPLQPTTP